MAQIEPMDIDAIESDFDNKENTFHHSNVLSRTPCTEKGYEELDVSELNMKLRYSITPASSPMSKSLTGPYLDNRNCNPGEDYLNNTVGTENGNLTRSLNSTLTKTESVTKSKVLPLQTLSADPFVDSNRNSAMRRLIEPDNNNVMISVSNTITDENLSLPSTSSSVTNTPEATTPTKEIPKPDGSPIMRGLKSVLSMFRPSQSPIPLADDKTSKQDILSPVESQQTYYKNESEAPIVLASTPVAANKQKDATSSRRSSPLKDSVVFNEDLERELQWKDETTIIFKHEKIPVHKLFFQNPIPPEALKNTGAEHLNATVEYMDISGNDSVIVDRTMTDINVSIPIKIEGAVAVESDNEFLDCETTFTKNESCTSDYKEMEMINKTEGIGNATADITENAQIKGINEPECKNVMNSTENIKTGDINVVVSEHSSVISESVTDIVARSLVENSSKIIEATMGMLKSEAYDHTIINDELSSLVAQKQNVSYQSESLVPHHNLQTEDLNTINGKIINDDKLTLNVINTDASVTADSKIDDLNQNKNQSKESSDAIEEMSNELPSEEGLGNVENLPDVCAVKLNKIEYSKVLLTEPTPVELKDNIESDLLKNDVEIYNDTNDSPCDIVVVKEDINDQITSVSMSNIEVQHVPDNLENTQILQHEIDPDLLRSISEIPIHDKNLSEGVLSSIIHESIVDNLPLAECINAENMNATNTIESELNVDDTNIDLEPKLVVNVNVNNIEAILGVNNANLKMDTSDNLESQVDVIQTSHIESNTAVNSIVLRDNDRDVPELSIGNDMVIRKSPSEIPLPDEDDVEQALLEPNYMSFTEVGITQDVTFEICDDNLVVHGESTNKLTADIIPGVTQNIVEERYDPCPTNIIIEHNVENAKNVSVRDYEELNVTHTCENNQNDTNAAKTEMFEKEIINMRSENLAHSEIDSNVVTSNLQITQNNSHIENYAFNDKSAKLIEANIDLQKMQITENVSETTNILTDNYDAVEKVVHDAEVTSTALKEDIDAAGLLDTVKSDYINNVDKFEVDVNQVKIEDNMQQEKELKEIDEEIITSANNSPYVSVTDLVLDTELNKEPLENTDIPLGTKTKMSSSPPISPKIVSKGYNFNFDDIDDPFATKTNIRMSPTPDSPNQTSTTMQKQVKKHVENPKRVNNRRKSQPERKKSAQKKTFNNTFNNRLPTKDIISEQNTDKQTDSTLTQVISPKDDLDNIASPSVTQNISDDKLENALTVISKEEVQKEHDTNDTCEFATVEQTSTIKKDDIQQIDEENKCVEQIAGAFVSNEKSTSSSEQYFSLGTSSGEGISVMNRSKNVFNLPEIEDMSFNPFATKSKMRMSPPPSQNSTYVTQETKNPMNTTTTDTIECDFTLDKVAVKDSSPNISNTTCSSNHTNDKDTTVREVLTEDEDTIEGPFLEAEDLKLIEKVTDMDVASDMMNFDEIPTQEKDENLENGELFIDADAFEFLLNQNKSSTVLDSGKESLFLKFDPLFAKRVSSDGVLAALSKVQKRQSTPKKITKPTLKDFTPIEKPVAGPSTEKDNYVPVEEYNEDLSSTMTKPMMVVNPAVSSIVSPRRSATPPKLNRRSLTFTSPAMAVIDRLLSLSGNSSHLDHNASIPLVSREYTETDLAITQLRELLAEKEIHVHNLRSESKELKDRLAALEVQVRNLESESTERLNKINDLNERLSEKTKINKSMATVVEEYERTIASLIAETEQDKKRNGEERIRLIKERDEQTAHLTSMEVSFSDLHSKYEKSKQIILSCKANEDAYKKSIKEFEDNFSKMQNNYELLKQHATSKLNHANQELEKMNRAHEAEVLKLNAMIKRKDMHITSLEETLTQKTKANEELTAICDELINKVG